MTLSKIEEFDNRIIFAKTLIKLAQENPKIVLFVMILLAPAI